MKISVIKKNVAAILTPYFMASTLIMHLYIKNMGDTTDPAVILKYILLFFSLSFLTLVITYALLQNVTQTAIITTLVNFFLTTAGYFTLNAETLKLGSIVIRMQVIGLYGELLLAASLLLLFKVKNPNLENLLRFLYATLSIFLIFGLFRITNYHLKYNRFVEAHEQKSTAKHLLNKDIVDTPDIYYIVLDTYSREDILNSLFDYQGTNLSEELRKRNFYVPSKSTSNYIQTSQSIASSLNMEYIQNIAMPPMSDRMDRGPLTKAIENNKVYALLKQLDYTFITVESLASDKNAQSDILVDTVSTTSKFEKEIFITTFLSVAYPLDSVEIAHSFVSGTKNTFNALLDVSRDDIPRKFVYMHSLMPHPPFVFDDAGEIVSVADNGRDGTDFTNTQEYYGRMYRNQVKFVSDLTLATVDQLIENTDGNAIIIIQGDHGSGMLLNWNNYDASYVDERFSILNAYYFPDHKYDLLYDTITPVNTFRAVFNKYFGTEFEMLERKNYFAAWNRPAELIDATDRLQLR